MAASITFGKTVLRALGVRRRHLGSMRMRLERSLMAAGAPVVPAAKGRILCYHGVGTRGWGVNDTSPRRFRRQLELALGSGYEFVPADVIARGDGQRNHLALTFDDGLTSVATQAAPLLADLGMPYTVFIVTDWVNGLHAFAPGTILTWQELERLISLGAAIGSHSVDHADLGRLPESEMYRQLSESKAEIERHLGIRPSSFAIPYGNATNWSDVASFAARQVGYEFVYAQAHNRRAAGTLPRTFISRFDDDGLFTAALNGAFDDWQEWG